MEKLKIGIMLLVCLLVLSTATAMTMAAEKKENINTLDTIRGADSDDNRYVPDEIIVKFKSGVKGSEMASINSKHKTEVLSTSQHGDFKLLKIAKGKSVPEMVEIYSKNPNVEYAESNYIRHIFVNDPYFSYQWHMTKINVEHAWGISTGNNVVVAVLDTGVAYENHGRYALAPDLAGTNFVEGYDYINDDSHPNDDQGHGTHVTGTIAQTTNNGVGGVGIAYDASIMPVKVLNAAGSGTDFSVAQGIYYAVNNGADIISMSLGGEGFSQILADAVLDAHNNGVVVIAAAGNSKTDVPHYPAAYDTVIAVGATRYDNTLAYYSNYGSYIDLVAPGGDVNVDQNGDGYGDGVLQQTFSGSPRNFGYWFYQGTSMAAPHVTGVAAMLIANGVIGPNAVKEALENSAIDLGASGLDSYYGHGLLNAYGALTYTSEPECTDESNCQTDGWYETGDMQWLSIGQCTEKEQKEEEYRDYYCSINSQCEYLVTGTNWVDTEATRDKPDGTACEDGYWCTQDVCLLGSCVNSKNTCDDEIDCTIDSCNESAETCSYDYSNCLSEPYCGDGTKDEGEECDGLDLDAKTCQDLSGYDGGTLSCNLDCTYNRDSCTLCGGCLNDVCDGKCHPRKENSDSCSDCW